MFYIYSIEYQKVSYTPDLQLYPDGVGCGAWHRGAVRAGAREQQALLVLLDLRYKFSDAIQ